jgi:hypothetical protein
VTQVVTDGRIDKLGNLTVGLTAAADADSGKAITRRPVAVSWTNVPSWPSARASAVTERWAVVGSGLGVANT